MMDENEVVRSLGRMEGKLDMLITRFDKLDERVDGVRQKQWYHTGVIGVAAVFLAPKIRAMLGL